ncbi:CsgG/HfaB family protein [Belnapia sp. F-4-1]|uniref:CsgG/HfaB family protein n=1 Tax=Belnapia sp. F-4-1 TaxID=1545443 RepID=UPI001917300C|nr:CsgG/HfaB family protein [Belnapia sp. F-4-1]
MPAPARKLDIAVFAFTDQTGRHLPNENFAEYSFAVTQGGAAILINTLKDAGSGRWFTVLERNRLADLFQERQIIRANRSEALGPNGQPLPPLGPLRNAGLMVTGGIIGYDSNVLTGGIGANFLGIGATTEYRRDNVSVYLRIISILTGEVLVSVTTDKTIYSVAVQGLLSRYVGFNRLLNAEAGVTTNEPRQVAVRQAIEKAVYAAILEGANRNYWKFADEDVGRGLVDSYLETRDGDIPDRATSVAPTNPPAEPARPRAEVPLVGPLADSGESNRQPDTERPGVAQVGSRAALQGRVTTPQQLARSAIGDL